MKSKTCHQCHSNFTVTDDDLTFYQKMTVPPPTWCPDCRAIRRMQWRNERSLYCRKCDATGVDIVSCFAPEKKLIVYDQKYWWSDAWDPLTYGQDYDFSQPFFGQWRELLHRVPQLSVSNANAENSEYCNVNSHSKDCYLISASFQNERVMYTNRVVGCHDCLDNYILNQSQYCYDNIACTNCYQVFYSQDSNNCRESYFLYNCHQCQNCLGCINLRNKQYCIFNQQCTKEEYEQQIKQLNLSSRQSLNQIEEKFSVIKSQSIRKFANLINCENCTGDNLTNCKNCKNCFDLGDNVQNCNYSVWGGYDLDGAFDTGPGVGSKSSLIYEAYDSGINSTNLAFTGVVYDSFQVRYSIFCFNCQNIFGCIGLRHKEYCILNKQYTKEEYEQLLPKIIAQMNTLPYIDRLGRQYDYGEFFPPEISPFAYNETVAQEYYPTTKELAIQQGFSWRDPDPKQFQPTILHQNIPDSIIGLDEKILSAVFECSHQGHCDEQCNQVFKILPAELAFYLKNNIPLPHLCPNCRHYQRIKKRNPLKLYPRQCMCEEPNHTHETRCPNQFATTYSPDRPEKVYCEECYQKSVI